MTKKKFPYVERDVSWMYFNHRILQEAEKESIPLLERLSFLGIYSNNLDEFFRVRVASLKRVASEGLSSKENNEIIKKTLKEINQMNKDFSKEYAATNDRIFKELREYKIRLLNEENINEEQKSFLKKFFYENINGAINPVWIDEIKDISPMEDNQIYFIVEKHENISKKNKYAIIKIPNKSCGRWVHVPKSEGFDNIMFLDDVVRFCLPYLFIGTPKSDYKAYSFKFTKDAEMEINTESDYSTMEKIAAGVSSRKRGEAVRLVYDAQMPNVMLKKIKNILGINNLDISLASGRYHNHKDLMSFPDCGRAGLRYQKWKHLMKKEFLSETSIFDEIRKKDLFIHVPYHDFDQYTRLLQEAAIQPEVKTIKTTLYRLAKDSKVVKALIAAARNGKKVTAVVELLARFDEESNIKWSKRMQEEGVNVIFGVEGLKIHPKLLLIKSKKGDIACIGTGNFHEGNAKIYTDYIMMTSRDAIVKDVEKVFDFINKPFSPMRFNELLVSPNSMKGKILRLMDSEIRNAKNGKPSWMKIKINHITDKDVVNKIYRASQAEVKIDLLVRGNCSLVCGLSGVSENVHAVGIIDRYLEHSRILIFCNDGKPLYYLGSADWMPRNLVERVEVMTPV